MKRKIAVIFLLLITTLCAAVGCGGGGGRDLEAMVKVVYCLEGGEYRNCTAPIVMYYGFEEGTENRIKNPAAQNSADRLNPRADVKRDGYELNGWFRTKTGEGENATYSDEWNFETDKVTADGVTLYAMWTPKIEYRFDVCYWDDDGQKVVIDGYTVKAGDKFNDKFDYRNNRPGYTALEGYYDKDGNPWDEDFVHPGGETSTTIDVFVKYEKGEFVRVSTAEELIANRTKDIMLVADIDLNGADFRGFGDYKKIFRGNGHTISNFNLKYDAGSYVDDNDLGEEGYQLCISLFGRMDGATVQDVTFENFTIDIKITYSKLKKVIVAPFCVKATDSTVQNVTVKPVYTFTELKYLDRDDSDQFALVTDALYYFERGSTFENTHVDVTDLTAGSDEA